MPHLSTNGRRPAAAVALPILLLACGGLTACGSSSPSSTSTTTANAAATRTAAAPSDAGPTGATGSTSASGVGPTGATGAGGPVGAARFAAVRACLQKNGVTLPQRPAGGGPPQRGGPGGFLGGGASGGPTLPKGMTRAQYAEVLNKCGGGLHRSRAFRGRHLFSSPTARQALSKFAACLRQNGVNIPEPNTSGKGPIFDTKGIDTASPQFRQAETKCRVDLLAALRSQTGTRSGTTGSAGSSATGSTG
jgi:hypothetical protein